MFRQSWCVWMCLALASTLVMSGCNRRLARGATKAGLKLLSESEEDTDPCEEGLIYLALAVEDYHLEKDAYPRTLTALVPDYFDEIPECNGEPPGYNPVTGEIFPSDDGPSPEDYLLMEDIREAITQYGTATGYYPPTLDDLYPNYLSSLPRTSTRRDFTYNNQNGELGHPLEGKQWGDSQ